MSDDSSDGDLPMDWIPYSKRPEWADVQPLAQDDGDSPVVVIAYTEKFREVYDYFRAVVFSSEKTARVLELTKDALKLNPANYFVWQYRREVLKEINTDLNEEIIYINDEIIKHPKNYQVWHHRRAIVELLNDPSEELPFTEQMLDMDSKNYHAWQHRQWAIKAFNLFDDELNYVDKLLKQDVRNNSAWNQRYFVLEHCGFTPEVIESELKYTMNRIRFVKNNESSWNFLRGLLMQGDGNLDQFPEVVNFMEELFNTGHRSPYLLAFLIDMYAEKALRERAVDQDIFIRKVYDLCDSMIKHHDIIRRKYWQYFVDKFKQDMHKKFGIIQP